MLYHTEKVTFYSQFAETFCQKGLLNFVKAFSPSIEMFIWVFAHTLYYMNYIDFSNVKPFKNLERNPT